MKLKIIKFTTVTAVLFLAVLPVLAIPSRPSPQRLVNDLVGIFTAEQTLSLEASLVAFDDSTSNQIAVVTVSDLEGYEPAEYAVEIGLKWGVGSKDFNNGIVVLLKPKTAESGGKVSIQTGYGLEGAIPDAYAKRIIENDMIPEFQKGDYYGGVVKACDELMALASGEISEPRDKSDEGAGHVAVILALFFFIFIIAMVLGSGKHGKGNGGGGNYSDSGPIFIGPLGGFGRGSFGGGGGSFGGGFGGFGGGGFGGGGASGSW